MSDPGAILWLIPALPLLAAAACGLAARTDPEVKRHAHWPCVLALGASTLIALLAMAMVMRRGGAGFVQTYFTWFAAGNVDVGLTLRADGLTAIMLVMITFIST